MQQFFFLNKVTKSIEQVGKLSLWEMRILGELDMLEEHQTEAQTWVPYLLFPSSCLPTWQPNSVLF